MSSLLPLLGCSRIQRWIRPGQDWITDPLRNPFARRADQMATIAGSPPEAKSEDDFVGVGSGIYWPAYQHAGIEPLYAHSGAWCNVQNPEHGF